MKKDASPSGKTNELRGKAKGKTWAGSREQEAGSREQEAKNRSYFYCPESKIHYISPEYLGRHSGEPCPGSVRHPGRVQSGAGGRRDVGVCSIPKLELGYEF